jgi:hypothetical protein
MPNVYKGMASEITKIRGVASGYPPVSFCLAKKNLPHINIVIGDDPAQVSWLEQRLQVSATPIEKVTDASVLGKSNLLLKVYMDKQVDLSDQVRDSVGIWSAQPLVKGSAGLTAAIKYAANLLQIKELPKDYVSLVAYRLGKKDHPSLISLVWKIAGLLMGDIQMGERWAYPWDDRRKWMPNDVEPAHRLHALYWDLVAYSYIKSGQPDMAKRMGTSPSKIKFLASLKLPRTKVASTVEALSKWRLAKTDALQTALIISSIWSKP